jgi:hypothetical protein
MLNDSAKNQIRVTLRVVSPKVCFDKASTVLRVVKDKRSPWKREALKDAANSAKPNATTSRSTILTNCETNEFSAPVNSLSTAA